MNEQKPIIVPEEIECSSGSVFNFNYKRVVYSLTMQPDKNPYSASYKQI